MKSLQEVAQHKGVRWGALLAVLVGMTQFNNGLELFYSKWSADKTAQAAEKKAEEAKQTADGVDERFDKYITEQRQAIETQNKIAEAIGNYAAQQQMPQMKNMPLPQERPQFFREVDLDGQCWQCTAWDYENCYQQQLWRWCADD